MSQPPYATDPFWARPDAACTICRGRGWVEQEGPGGLPAAQVPCPYCHGRRDASWVAEKQEKAFDGWDYRRMFIGLAIVAMVIGNFLPWWDPGYAANSTAWWPSALFALHIIAWIVLLGYAIASPKLRHPGEKGRSPRHAPGFTTDREKAALGIFGAVVAAKGAWDSYERKMHKNG